MTRFFRLFLVNLLIIISLFITIESSLRLVNYLVFGAQRYRLAKYVNSEIRGVYNLLEEGNNLGFNSNYNNSLPGEIKHNVRILVIGGSGAGGSKKENWPEILMKLLNKNPKGKTYEVFNGGVGGATSSRELFLLSRLLYLKPDIVIIYDGWNDAYFSHYAKNLYFSYNKRAHKIAFKGSRVFNFFLKRHLEISRQFSKLREIFKETKAEKIKNKENLKLTNIVTKPNVDKKITELNLNESMKLAINYEGEHTEYLISFDTALEDNLSIIYSDNLSKIVELCQKHNARCILITQPSILFYKANYNPSLDLSGVLNLESPKLKDWQRTVQVLYPKIIEIGKKISKEKNCLYFDFNNLNFIYNNPKLWPALFTDDVHQNLKGKELIASRVYSIIKENDL